MCPSSFYIPCFSIFLPTSHNFLIICLFFCPSDRCPCPGKPLKGQLTPTYSGFWQAQGPVYTTAGWSMSPSCLSCKGSKWAFKHFFSYLSQETVLGIFWQALFPPLSLPYTGVYFCFGFLLEVTRQFCISSPPKFSTSPVLHYMLIFIVSASITFTCFLSFTLQLSPPFIHIFYFSP